MSDLTLADFLRARLGEDEAVAREARAAAVENDTVREDVSREHEIDPVSDSQWGPSDDVYMSTARVLADVEAKRRIVEREVNSLTPTTWRRELVLRDLASVYAQHPDYEESWRR